MLFDPEGAGYDMETALSAGLDKFIGEDGHWPSRHPITGQMLKGRQHPTFQKAIEADLQLGFHVTKGRDGKYYSFQSGPEIAGPPEFLEKKASTGRKVVRHADRSLSTELGRTIPDPRQPNKWVNFPSIHQGKIINNEDELAEIFLKFNGIDPETGYNFGAEVFDSMDEAVKASKRRSQSITAE